MFQRIAVLVVLAALSSIRYINAEQSDTKVDASGSVYFQIGQMVKTYDPSLSGWPDKTWDQRTDLRLSMDATIRKRLQIMAGVEFAMVTQAQPPLGGGSSKGTNSYNLYFSALQAQGIYSFFRDPQDSAPPLQIALGYFPFKYDPQACHMGEYLFRTGTYPPYIINDFDNCKTRLLGLRVSSTLFGDLRQDLLFTSETYFQPVGDYSLSYLVGYKAGGMFDFGAGVSFCRILPLDPALTTPPDGIVLDANNLPVIENGDTLHYTMSGTKLMARLSFDPKAFFDSPRLFGLEFGLEDGKIYTETAVLGLKDYGTYYNNILKRWPVMIGFDVPVFKALDVLSIELEYFSFEYNKMDFPPSSPSGSLGQYANWVSSNMFHWSIYASKNLFSSFFIKGMVGKDHYRNTGVNTAGVNWVDMPTSSEYLMGQNDWHYELRLMYSF
jgi:hypothetical protein